MYPALRARWMGDPPALPGRLPEFDSSGSDLRIRVVNRSQSTTGNSRNECICLGLTLSLAQPSPKQAARQFTSPQGREGAQQAASANESLLFMDFSGAW